MASFSQNKSFLANKSDLKLVIDGSQMGTKYVTLMLSVVIGKRAINNLIMVAALAFCLLMNFGSENEHNSLKIKVQRIDKK